MKFNFFNQFIINYKTMGSPESFNFSRANDQKQFESLPQEPKDILIDNAHGEAIELNKKKNLETIDESFETSYDEFNQKLNLFSSALVSEQSKDDTSASHYGESEKKRMIEEYANNKDIIRAVTDLNEDQFETCARIFFKIVAKDEVIRHGGFTSAYIEKKLPIAVAMTKNPSKLEEKK
jgi:hypothetical protein